MPWRGSNPKRGAPGESRLRVRVVTGIPDGPCAASVQAEPGASNQYARYHAIRQDSEGADNLKTVWADG